MNTFTNTISSLTIAQKRDLVKQLREAIKQDAIMIKQFKLSKKAEKEAAKKDKLNKAILAAQEKLAKLQAKLA